MYVCMYDDKNTCVQATHAILFELCNDDRQRNVSNLIKDSNVLGVDDGGEFVLTDVSLQYLYCTVQHRYTKFTAVCSWFIQKMDRQ